MFSSLSDSDESFLGLVLCATLNNIAFVYGPLAFARLSAGGTPLAEVTVLVAFVAPTPSPYVLVVWFLAGGVST